MGLHEVVVVVVHGLLVPRVVGWGVHGAPCSLGLVGLGLVGLGLGCLVGLGLGCLVGSVVRLRLPGPVARVTWVVVVVASLAPMTINVATVLLVSLG